MESIVLFASFFILLIMMVPIGYAIGIATLIAILVCGDGSVPLLMISQKAITGCDSFPLMAVPFFMLAGNLMSGGGIAKRILNFFDTFMGFITGGLSMVTTITCMFFAAISGSAIATTSAVGSFMIPAMKDKGYHEGYSAAICAAAGTIGVIIPPQRSLCYLRRCHWHVDHRSFQSGRGPRHCHGRCADDRLLHS